MAGGAKIFNIPDTQREVVAQRVGGKVILEPADEWSSDFIAALGSWSEEIERPKRGCDLSRA